MRKNKGMPFSTDRQAAAWLFVAFMIGSQTLTALQPVSRDQAQTVARQWLALCVSRTSSWAGSREPKINGVRTLSSANGALLGYVVSVAPAGHIVVPGVRELPPVKAYSPTRPFVTTPTNAYASAILADLGRAREALERAAAQRGPSALDVSANLGAWSMFLANTRDAYAGIQGLAFARRDPLLDDLDRWDPQRQPAGDHFRYSGDIAWHPHAPLNSQLPRVRTTPEEIWIDRDQNGFLLLGDGADAIAYDADLSWLTVDLTVGSQTGLYYYDADAIGTYRKYSILPDELALDPTHFTNVWGQGYDVWKDEDGGVSGQYDQAFDTRVYDGGDGWTTPDGSGGSQADLYYNDSDSSGDYTNWYGYPLLGGAAVAFGEIMRYWEWPDVGRGSYQFQWAYHDGGQDAEQTITLAANFEHPYTWNQMPIWGLHNGVAATDEINEVARLLADVGICFGTDFQLASPVIHFSDETIARFAYHFRYNANAIRLIQRADYSDDQTWFSLIQAELDAHRPVMLVPYRDEQTIHPLVADGYDKLAGSANLYLLHCNMGWSGVSDYWYALDNIGGIPGGAVDGALGAVQLQQAVVNILPTNTQRSAVAEVFRRTNNARGDTVSASLQNLQNEYGGSRFLVLAYHPDPTDALYPSDAATQQFLAQRATDMGIDANGVSQGVRTVTVFDADPTQAYDTPTTDADDPGPILGGQLQRRLREQVPFRIVGDAVVANAGNQSPNGLPYVKADVYVTSLDENVDTWTNLRLRAFLVEGQLNEGGTNYEWVVRRLLRSEELTLGTGETRLVNVAPVHPAELADVENSDVIVILEDTQTGHILQAGLLDRHIYGHPYLGNQPPTAPAQVTVTSVFDTGTLQALEATAVGADDPDGDRLTYLVRWFRNGTEVLEGDNHFTLTAAEVGGFSDGDAWFCDIRVRDAFYFAVDAEMTQALMFALKLSNPYLGSPITDLRDSHETTPASSNMVNVIGNLPPTNGAPSVPSLLELSNPNPASTEDVRCLAGGSIDPEGDQFSYIFAWFRYDAGAGDFLAVPAQTRALLPADATQAGEEWLCKVASRDHWGAQSAWLESSHLTVGAPDLEAPSKPLHASITPGVPSYVSDLTCSTPVGITAPGNFEVSYRWWKRIGPAWELTDITGPTVSKDLIAIGEAWACEVYAVRTDIAPPSRGPSFVTDEVVIRNFAPADPVASVFPSIAGADEDLKCNVSGVSDPEDETNVTLHYQWIVDGVVSGIEVSTVQADATSAGEGWYCRVYAQDTLGARSRIVQTSTILIGTRPTPPTEVLLMPAAPEDEDDLNCIATGSTDADGDVIRYIYTWYREEIIQAGLTKSTVPANLTRYAEHWRCQVRAFDGLLASDPISTRTVRIGGNEAPSAPDVTIQPDPANPGQSLECVITTTSSDPEGGEVTYYFTWYRDEAKTAYTNAVLPAGVTLEGETWQCHVYAQDSEGARSNAASSQPISLVNQAPSAPASVAISPGAPKSNVPLQCTADGAIDVNGDEITYVFEWFHYTDDPASAVQSPTTISTVPASETADGQNWYCDVHAVDSHGAAGDTVRSVVVTIGDVPPGAPARATLSPVPAGTSLDLVCSASGANDPNGDPVSYVYQWYRNGIAEAGQTDYRLPAALLTFGDVWSCRVKATDGTYTSDETISNEVTIQNLAPTGPTAVEIVPSPPTELDDLICNATGAADPEGEPVRFAYEWFRNGNASGYSGARLPAAATAIGEVWGCVVTVTDSEGLAAEPVTSEAVTVLSAAPSTPTVLVTPGHPTVSQTLTCAATGSEDPLGGEITYSFQWFRDNTDSGIAESTVSPAATHTDEVWKCVVTARNSHGLASVAVTSNEVVIDNHAPSAPSVVVQPGAPRPGAVIVCVASGSVDPDGHAVVYAFDWYKDGVSTGISTAAVPASTTLAGESWECHVTVTDAYGAVGPTVVSAAVTIGNEAPTVPAVTVTPAVPVLGGTLTCSATGSTDPNGDTVVYTYRWQNDAGGGPWADSGDTGPTVGPIANDGWSWRCVVQATDGDLASAEVTSNTVTVAGHAPTDPTAVDVTPAAPGVSDDLLCTASGSTDSDADAVTYVFLWYRNGVPTGFAGTVTVNGDSWTSTLAADLTGDGETWYCRVYALDARGAASDPTQSNSVTVQEPPPDPPTAAQIFPPVPTVNNALRCIATAPDQDGSGNPLATVFTWIREGQVQTDYTGVEVPASATAINERWVCEVQTRNAAGALSDPLRSDEVIVGAAGNDAFENDNDREAATEVAPGSFQAHGLDANDPGDWLRFRIDRLSEIRVDVEVLTGQNQPRLSLYRQGEAQPFAEEQGAPIRVSGIWAPGVYEAHVQAATRGSDTWFYGFRLSVDPAASLGTDTGAPADYTVNSSQPSRWYYFVLRETTTVTLALDLVAGQADFVLTVIDDLGNVAAQSKSGDADLTATLNAGRFLVHLEGENFTGGRALDDVHGTLTVTGASTVATNHPPQPPLFVRVLPENAAPNDRLVAVANGAVDPDASTQADIGQDVDPNQAVALTYFWYRNGLYVPEWNTREVPSAAVDDGDSWSCRVVAVDGYGAGSDAVESNTVTVGGLPEWTVSLQAIGAATDALAFGQNNQATNGWDVDFDDVAPPADPDATSGRVYLLGPGNHPELSRDIRAAGGTLVFWYIKVSNRNAVDLTWDASTVPAGAALEIAEIDANGAVLPGTSVNMLTDNQLDLSGAGQTTTYRIAYTAGMLQYETIALEKGWNLVSFWLQGEFDAVDLVFQGVAQGSIWYYDGASSAYRAAQVVTPMDGYWVYAATSVELQHIGYPTTDGARALAKGWNLAGPLADVPVPGASAIQAVWGWNGTGYEAPVLLQRGKGYWFFTTSETTVDLK